jgi:hypothetical protein
MNWVEFGNPFVMQSSKEMSFGRKGFLESCVVAGGTGGEVSMTGQGMGASAAMLGLSAEDFRC